MRTPTALAAALTLALAACGAAPPPPDATQTAIADDADPTPSPVGDSPPGDSPPGDGAEPTEAAAAAPEPASEASEADSLARDLIKTGGRRIGYSASKKSFVYPLRSRAGDEYGLDIIFTDDSGHKRDSLRICQPGECEEQLKERSKALLPELSARLSRDGFEGVRAIGWPSHRDELDVMTLNLTLRFRAGTLEAVPKGKPAARLGAVRPPKLQAVFVVPETKLLGVLSSADGQDHDQVFTVFRLP